MSRARWNVGLSCAACRRKIQLKNHNARSEVFVTLYFMDVVNYDVNGRRKVCGLHLLHPGHVVSAKSINAMRERFPGWLSGKYHFVSVPVSPRYLHQPLALMATSNYRRPHVSFQYPRQSSTIAYLEIARRNYGMKWNEIADVSIAFLAMIFVDPRED